MAGCNSLFCDLVSEVIDLINLLVPVLMGVAVVLFMLGVVNFVAKAGDTKARGQGKKNIFWGLTALFVLFSIWGLIRLLDNAFFGGVNSGSTGGGVGSPMDIRSSAQQDPWRDLR